MQFATTILLAILATLGATAPTIQARACSTITPNAMQFLLSSDPDSGSSPHALNGPLIDRLDTQSFNLFQDNVKANDRYEMRQFVDFQVPPGSYSCALHVTDEGNSVENNVYIGEQHSSDTEMAKVAVKSLVPNAFLRYPSYNDVGDNMDPSLVSAESFGTFSIKNGTNPGTINSRACPPPLSNGEDGHLQFVFELEGKDYSRTRYFSMTQRNGGAGGALNGVYMTFNC
ncbi:hypothetical protein DL98DRAFT_651619 [Cadophora sp. DSE1049]|nr:hypothetical protein DL98DRAFT_651619 [Cadophora sp. DSE1049]